jgi:hypothetical protein
MIGNINGYQTSLEKVSQNETEMATATCGIAKNLTAITERQLHMNNFFSSPDLSDSLCKEANKCCGTVRQNDTGIPQGSDSTTPTTKKSTRVKHN